MFKSSGDSLDQILKTYPQLTYLIVICAMTISSYLFFRTSKLNFAEGEKMEQELVFTFGPRNGC